MDNVIETLQTRRSLPASTKEIVSHPGEMEFPEGTTLGTEYTFADNSDTGITTLEAASSLLNLDELKALAKDAKIQGKNKMELLNALRRTSQRQTGLGYLIRSDTEESIRSTGSSLDEEDVLGLNRDAHFMGKIMAETGPCIRLTSGPLKLFERVHLVFYRSTEWTEKSLTTIILARIARWSFPEYIVSRSTNIFPSRSLLLEFEASLRTQFRVDNILEFNGTPKPAGLQGILDIFEEVHPRWRTLLNIEQDKEDRVYETGEGAYLRRLSPAWVYTRIIHKATNVFGKVKEHLREHGLLSELLSQTLFHSARRGAWYQRKALLEEHYMAALKPLPNLSDDQQKRHWKRIALATCEEGLQDQLVHLIYHYDLQKRVKKLEKQLKIPRRLQHDFAHVRLAAPVEVVFTGIQIEKPLPHSKSTALNDTDHTRQLSDTPSRRGAKTIWLDPSHDNYNAHVNVEGMVLSHYRMQGYKGYHSEGGILRTLFAYLFYDVLFTYLPNVFQTSFQTCPLDLHTDAFYPSRMSQINRRLAEVGNGTARDILTRVWEQHSEKKTCVIGLDWTFELNDLLEICDCFEGEALATVLKVLAQEYGQRGGGVPDLFLWSTEKKEVCFAEVKSANDRLSDTQRLWISVLSGAGVRVELANAVASELRVVE